MKGLFSLLRGILASLLKSRAKLEAEILIAKTHATFNPSLKSSGALISLGKIGIGRGVVRIQPWPRSESGLTRVTNEMLQPYEGSQWDAISH